MVASPGPKLAATTNRRMTDLANKKMEIAFRVFKLDTEPESFSEKHYLNVKNLCLKLSSGGRTVKIINDLLRVIFST